ncbi:MAG: magnesium transporter CorA family protein [Pseudomonadota bacterium]|nr:magnesium transporter CorA family protein [Pseudomonadota bacterium]
MLDCFPSPAVKADPKSAEGVAWIDLVDPTESEIEFVENSTGYRVPSREALSEIQTSSRNFLEKDAVYLSTPLIAHAFSHEGALGPVGFILGPKLLITVRFSQFRAFDNVRQEVVGLTDLTANEAFVRLLENIIDKGADLLEHVSGELDSLSHSAFHVQTGQTNKLSTATQRLRDALRKVGRLGDRLSQIRDVLLGVGRIVGYVIETRCADMGEGRRQRLNAVRADVASLNDYESHLSNKVQFLLDATLGFINIEQNDIVKVLTIASIVGVPPVFFAGVWGMNFKNIPELSWSFGYPFAWAVMILSAVVPLIWFKWRGWM